MKNLGRAGEILLGGKQSSFENFLAQAQTVPGKVAVEADEQAFGLRQSARVDGRQTRRVQALVGQAALGPAGRYLDEQFASLVARSTTLFALGPLVE